MFPSPFIFHVTFTSAFLSWFHYFGDISPQQMYVAFAGIDFHRWFVIGSHQKILHLSTIFDQKLHSTCSETQILGVRNLEIEGIVILNGTYKG